MRSATDAGRRLRAGDYVMKKKSSFPRGAARKMCAKLVVDAFEITSRVATNAFRCKSVISGEETILSGDHLVRLRNYDRESVILLCREMERTQRNTDARAELPRTRARVRIDDNADNSDIDAVSASSHRRFNVSSLTFSRLIRFDGASEVNSENF